MSSDSVKTPSDKSSTVSVSASFKAESLSGTVSVSVFRLFELHEVHDQKTDSRNMIKMLRIEKPLYPEFIEGQTKRADTVIRPYIKKPALSMSKGYHPSVEQLLSL